MRMNNSRPVKKVWQARMTRKKKRGRTRKTWENSIGDILTVKNVTWNEASKKLWDMKEWAKFVRVFAPHLIERFHFAESV